jgi:hypothetical protein
MSKIVTVSIAALLGSLVVAAGAGLAQEPSKDAALDAVLKDVQAKKPESQKPARAQDSGKPGEAKKARSETPAAKKPGGDVAPDDKELDGFLQKLGETHETPAPQERQGGMPGPGGEPKPGPGGKNSPDELKGESRQLDEHLEQLTGRRRKQKGSDGEGTGPLAKIIKEMRDVEERLGKPDTGDETRKKQSEIVKQLDQVIEQLKSQGQSQRGRAVMRLVQRPGQRQPGEQNGEQQSGRSGGAPNQKPEKPDNRRSMAGGKDSWGHLPDALREELENASSEEGLSKREALIKRYFDSLAKKSLVRAE